MASAKIQLVNRLGLHARAASKLVARASEFQSEIWLTRAEKRVNAKSIMGVLMLAAPMGTELELECNGPDADQALAALQTLVAERFGEDQ